jgi:L-lactate dehydrogenase complex protein LldF
MLSHSEASEKFISDAERTDWHDETLWFVRAKRDKASKVLPEIGRASCRERVFESV